MKTVFTLIIGLIIEFSASAENPKFSYVTTQKDTLLCKNIFIGAKNTRCILNNSKKVTFDNQQVLSFYKNGKMYSRKPIINNSIKTGEKKFMELIAYYNGIKVYSYCYYNSKTNELDRVFCLYKNGEHYKTLVNPCKKDIRNCITKQNQDRQLSEALSSR